MDEEMIKKINKIRDNIDKAQKEIENKEFTCRKDNVFIVMRGTRKVVKIIIDAKEKEFINSLELIQKNLLLAMNDILEQIENTSKELFLNASEN
ncbi:YbaB/EbfC family DNA-binding protein [Texas Phoenix palm phytoplasma]|uniref:YbaB/EbfC family DNA-binding protein n=1 Tax=Texas Phoenix palm phytoplasma TaxID=176709 RepID=A0ABS5BIE0_9MOLU|nr:YbaB/EbfC family nucleoid-associated protein [Texas Phoenix palm phytoplasma]MBP3059346.1 YbaB/EbfC family DNA-binding protein [Texas Phoenix palm phytoplasma]